MKLIKTTAGKPVAVAMAVIVAGMICGAQAQKDVGAGLHTVLKAEPATTSTAATRAPILGATKAGKRVVAVGSYGIILLSDNEGQSFRQAKSVPVSSTLTAVSFADDKHGWAVGHRGVVLATEDGGETWQLQRSDLNEDRPLFSVHFFDRNEGVAVGLWSLVLATSDGGKTWTPSTIREAGSAGESDRNLFRLFASPSGSLFAAAERGAVLRSDDRGRSWNFLDTGYKGSLWSGLVLKDGTLLVGGLRGSVYRSTDNGHTWNAVKTDARNSITDMVETEDRVVALGLNGVRLESRDRGLTFIASQRDDRLSFTAAVPATTGDVIAFSKAGVVAAGPVTAVAAK